MLRLTLAQNSFLRKILASLIGVAVGAFLLVLLRLTILAPAENSIEIRPDNLPHPVSSDSNASKDTETAPQNSIPLKTDSVRTPTETKVADSYSEKLPIEKTVSVVGVDSVEAEKTEGEKTAVKKPPEKEKSKMEALLQQGGEKLAAGKTDEAIELFRQAVKLEPKNPAVLRELAMGLLLSGKHKESVEVYKAIIKLDPDDDKARYNLATSFFRSRDFYEAEQIYLDLLTRDPENTKILSNLATLYYMQGKLSYAADQWREVVRVEPKNANAHTMLGEVLMELSKYKDAMKEYTTAAGLQPDSMDAWLNMAIAAHKSGSGGRALTGIERAIKLDPKNARALAMQGDIFIDIYRTPGNKDKTALDRALESWEQSLKIKPDQKVLQKRLEFYRNLSNSK